MISMPAAYNPYADVRRVSGGISFAQIDVNATPANLTVHVIIWNRNLFFSQPEQTVNGLIQFTKKIATMETNGWILNGTYDYVDEEGDNGQIGFWYNRLSSSGQTLGTNFLVVRGAQKIRCEAITIIFDEIIDIFPTSFSVQYLNEEGVVIKQVDVSDNTSARVVVEAPPEGFRDVSISAIRLNKEGKFFRVCQVLMGELKEFGADDINEMSCSYYSSIYGETFPSAMLTVGLDNSARQYNITNPSGVYRYLQQGQGLNGHLVINGMRVNMGKFYFANCESSEGAMIAKITAYDRAWLLDNVMYNGGTAGTWTVGEAVNAVINATELKIQTSIPEDVAIEEVARSVPQGTTCREALRLISQACRCVVFFSREDVLTFRRVGGQIEAADTLGWDEMTEVPEAEDLGMYNRVELSVRDDYSGNETVYVAEDISDGDPVHILSIENPLVVDGQAVADWILEMNKYRVRLSCEGRGNPAREVEDICRITDAYKQENTCRVVEEEFRLRVGLEESIKGVMRYAL